MKGTAISILQNGCVEDLQYELLSIICKIVQSNRREIECYMIRQRHLYDNSFNFISYSSQDYIRQINFWTGRQRTPFLNFHSTTVLCDYVCGCCMYRFERDLIYTSLVWLISNAQLVLVKNEQVFLAVVLMDLGYYKRSVIWWRRTEWRWIRRVGSTRRLGEGMNSQCMMAVLCYRARPVTEQCNVLITNTRLQTEWAERRVWINHSFSRY